MTSKVIELSSLGTISTDELPVAPMERSWPDFTGLLEDYDQRDESPPPKPNFAPTSETSDFVVLRREGGFWDYSAQVLGWGDTLEEAQEGALRIHQTQPSQVLGVFRLVSEVHPNHEKSLLKTKG